MQHERILNAVAGVQWMDHGGYCGAWSIQRTTMAKGAYISQQQVRNHTVPGGGNDEEIVETNIELALRNLKIEFQGFDYKHLPTPQSDAYLKWIKSKLAAGHGIVWMIMLKGGQYPVYPSLAPYGQYSHIEPVVGILSNHPLNDSQVYDDDYIAHFTDADLHTYYRKMSSLPDDVDFQGNCKSPTYSGYPCTYAKYGFGWSIEGFADARSAEALPLSLAVAPNREPETRDGAAPIQLTGTITIDGLVPGKNYAVYRWDDVSDAFDYSRPKSVHRFTASAAQQVYTDTTPFWSQGTTYYRCLEDMTVELQI